MPAAEARVTALDGEAGAGVSFSQAEVMAQSRAYSALYAAFVPPAAARLAAERGLAPREAEVVARRAVVPLLHAFLDRFLRLGRLSKGASVAAAPAPGVPGTIEEFQQGVLVSPRWNAWLLGEAAGARGLETSPWTPDAVEAAGAPAVNHNYRYAAPGAAALAAKLAARLRRMLPASPVRVAALPLAYEGEALRRAGFYGRLLGAVDAGWEVSAPPADAAARAAAARELCRRGRPALETFLGACGAPTEDAARAETGLAGFLARAWPASLDEGLAANMESARAALRPLGARALLVSDPGDTRSTLTIAAARGAGLRVIGSQHGGHYGYLKDFVDVLELEYPFVDEFLTWGWTEPPIGLVPPAPRFTPLPSPWLSERRRFWAGAPRAAAPSRDVLLMSNKVKRFPAAPTGASSSRVDLLGAFAARLEELVAECARRDLTVVHKMYDRSSRHLLADTLERLKAFGGPRYEPWEKLDKGLTPELVGLCRVVAWDQPGTGFLECLAAGIPSMVLWPRDYNEEEASAAPAFAALEKAGLVHRTAASLAEALLVSRDAAWWEEPARRAAAAAFSSAYGRTDDAWEPAWRRLLEAA